MALTPGGVPTPADLATLTEDFYAGQKLRPSQVDEFTTKVDGDKLRTSDFPDIA
jgi:hypothetical protein